MREERPCSQALIAASDGGLDHDPGRLPETADLNEELAPLKGAARLRWLKAPTQIGQARQQLMRAA